MYAFNLPALYLSTDREHRQGAGCIRVLTSELLEASRHHVSKGRQVTEEVGVDLGIHPQLGEDGGHLAAVLVALLPVIIVPVAHVVELLAVAGGVSDVDQHAAGGLPDQFGGLLQAADGVLSVVACRGWSSFGHPLEILGKSLAREIGSSLCSTNKLSLVLQCLLRGRQRPALPRIKFGIHALCRILSLTPVCFGHVLLSRCCFAAFDR